MLLWFRFVDEDVCALIQGDFFLLVLLKVLKIVKSLPKKGKWSYTCPFLVRIFEGQ